MENTATKLCQTCKNHLSITEFNTKVEKATGNAVLAGSCKSCAQSNAAKANARRAAKKAHTQPTQPEVGGTPPPPPRSAIHRPREKHFDDVGGLVPISMHQLEGELATCENVLRVKARIMEESFDGKTLRERADAIAASVGECMKYRFIYSSHYESKELPYVRFMYSCAQLSSRQHAPRKSDTKKQRDKGLMDTFTCDGWLHMMVWEVWAPVRTSSSAFDGDVQF
ncbi:hypothetical protein HDZ31DRAFT_77437 [Schizophyllum fasciatum]